MLTIRKPTESDAAQISALICSVMHHFLAEPDGKGAEKFLVLSTPQGTADFIGLPTINYLLGEEDGLLCGVVAVRNNSHLQHLFVAAEFQGRGIGKLLWLTARDQALAAGNPGEFTVNASLNAVPFYERMGFKPESEILRNSGLVYQNMKISSRCYECLNVQY